MKSNKLYLQLICFECCYPLKTFLIRIQKYLRQKVCSLEDILNRHLVEVDLYLGLTVR